MCRFVPFCFFESESPTHRLFRWRFGLATFVGEIQPQGCVMVGEAEEPHWKRARREKRASHKAERREGAAEAGES